MSDHLAVGTGGTTDKRQRLLNFLAERLGKAESQGIQPRKGPGPTPLSFAQRRLWFFHQLAPLNPTYHVPLTIRIRGALNLSVMETVLNEIVRRHESLRTVFAVGPDGEPVQDVLPHVAVPLAVTDLCHLPEEERELRVRQLNELESRQLFDLESGLPIRFGIIRLDQQEHILQVTMHHIISDGWSLAVLVREMGALYEAYLAGAPSPLPALAIQYPDFALWQTSQFRGNQMESQIAYWREHLNGANTVLDLPIDRRRTGTWSFNGAECSRVLPLHMLEGLRELSRREKTTLFATVMAAFQALIYRYTGQEDIIVGTASANRSQSEIEPLIGFFVNMLPIRTRLTGGLTFRELLHRVRLGALGAFANQDVPFDRLVEIARVQRDTSRSPLVQVVCSLQNAHGESASFGGLQLNVEFTPTNTAKFDLVMDLFEQHDGLRISCEYNTDLFNPETIVRLMDHYRNILEAVLANPELRVNELPILSPYERHRLLVEWNDTDREYPQTAQCVHSIFEEQAARRPTAVAAVFENQRLTYGELNARANRLAHALREEGVGPETLVGICLERSLTMLVAVLGVLKAGAAYVPVDPDYPADRIAFMLEDTRSPVVLTEEKHAAKVGAAASRLLLLDGPWAERVTAQSMVSPENLVGPGNLAYVIFTSGSTGRPKGVLIEHRSVTGFIAACQELMVISPADRILQFASLGFDVSVFEIFSALLSGATLCLARRDSLITPEGLSEIMREQAITIADIPPAMLALLDPDSFPDLRILFIGTEPFSGELVNRWARPPQRRFLNGYGPTEATVALTVMDCVERYDQTPPIGRPMPNQRVYVVDKDLQLVPVGVPGELYVGGAGLARSYLNRPALTAERFLENPYLPGTRLYRTGDQVRWLPDGNLEFLGRVDQQVKIRGFRIELCEVEAVLNKHPAVRQVLVTAREDLPGGKGLVAYLVPQGEGPFPSTRELRRFLAQSLPGFLIPSAFVTLPTMPLAPSGKVDHRALPVPSFDRSASGQESEVPATRVEVAVAEIMAKLLGVDSVGMNDDFFELGGNSLQAAQLRARLRDALHVELPLHVLFESPRAVDLARALEEADPGLEATLG